MSVEKIISEQAEVAVVQVQQSQTRLQLIVQSSVINEVEFLYFA